VLVFRAALAAVMVLLGVYILVEMFSAARAGGFAVVPGVVLGAAMLLLGAHRLRLIARVWGTR
jgi:hypothetical protein